MIEIQPEHIRYLEVGDTFYETGYWHKIDLRVIEKPTYNATECNWTWKAIDLDTYKVIDYLVKDSWACYIHIYFTEETAERIEDVKMKETDKKLKWTLDWQTATLTLNKETVHQVLKDATKKLRLHGREIPIIHHTFKTTWVGDMVNVVTDVPLKGKTFDKMWIDENIPF